MYREFAVAADRRGDAHLGTGFVYRPTGEPGESLLEGDSGLEADVEYHMDDFVANAKRLYDNSVKAVLQTTQLG